MAKRKPKPKAANTSSRKQALQKESGIEREEPAIAAQVLAKGRAGRKGVVIYLNPMAKKALTELAHERRKSLQELGIEAINYLFRTYDRKPIA